MTADVCPHCLAPVRGDGRPICLCAAAEAEDFDPLRVRPYVRPYGRHVRPSGRHERPHASLPDRGGNRDQNGNGWWHGHAPATLVHRVYRRSGSAWAVSWSTVPIAPSPPGASSAPPPPTPTQLWEGAGGPEVVELQERLRQLALYPWHADGWFDADVRAAVARYQQVYGVQGDPEGVYGAATRASLEAHTSEP